MRVPPARLVMGICRQNYNRNYTGNQHETERGNEWLRCDALANDAVEDY